MPLRFGLQVVVFNRIGGLAVCLALVVAASSLPGAEPATDKTEVLAKYEALRFGMMVGYGPHVFTEKNDPLNGPAPPAQNYAPTKLDVGQWVAVAKKAKMRYVVLGAKVPSGFCLWDSKFADYDVAATANKTDVVAEFVKACRQQGVAPCLRFSLGWDVAHRIDRNMSDDQFYEFAHKQIAELLTNYGPITTLWFDGLERGKTPLLQLRIAYDTVKSLQPDCLVVVHTPRPTYSREIKWWPADVFQPGVCVAAPEGHNPRMEYQGKTYYLPMEGVGTIVREWTWRPNNQIEPLPRLLKRYRETAGRGANLTVVLAPDREGKIPAEQVERLMELSKAIERLDEARLPSLNQSSRRGGSLAVLLLLDSFRDTLLGNNLR